MSVGFPQDAGKGGGGGGGVTGEMRLQTNFLLRPGTVGWWRIQ